MAVIEGSVESWDDEEGWGVLASPATPGGCWAHFSAVAAGGRDLVVGEQVRFTVEEADQDGFRYRAVEVWPAAAPPDRSHQVIVDGPSDAYRSTLTLSFDDPDT